MLYVALNQIKSQLEFVTMIVSTGMHDFLYNYGGAMNTFSCLFPAELVVRWARDFYEFGENDPATVQLVTGSVFESATVRIQGFPRHIPLALNGALHRNRLPSLSVCGPRVPG